ncbi:MAG TPA: D-glycerate dehydrogenase [Alphaproteobacteria bacterium]|nr:D-glycerate dehydrogenase [Alphaproteobacteria bacterium]
MTRPKVLITRRWPQEVERYLAERYELTLNKSDAPLTSDALASALQTQDALCPTVTDRITADMLKGARTKIIANYGVGFSHIDVDACQAHGIIVTNTPDVLTDATADIAITLMLMVARRAGEGERQVRSGNWTGWRPTHMIGTHVTGKTLGIVGLGRIGLAVARRAHRGLGMKIIYYARSAPSREAEIELGARRCSTLEELLAQSDFVSLHCPGGAANRHLIDASRLVHMKRTAFLINTARGEVVHEAALISALKSGAIAGAGLDVYEQEPRVPDALIEMENVVLLPHLGSATSQTRIAMGMRAAENLGAFFSGQALPDRIV